MPRRPNPRQPRIPARDRDYHVITASVYPEDLERADRLVALEKAAGRRRANRSSVIRDALAFYERAVLASQPPTNPQPEENLCPTHSAT